MKLRKKIILAGILFLFLIVFTLGFLFYRIYVIDQTDSLLKSCSPTWTNSKIISQSVAGENTLSDVPNEEKWKSVDLNDEITQADKFKKGDKVKINLCSDANYEAQIDDISKDVNNTTTIRGRIQGNPSAYILINNTQDKSLIEIDVPEKNQQFLIQSSDSDQDFLIDRSGIKDGLEDSPVLSPPTDQPAPQGNNDEPPPAGEASTTVDVMVVYTTEAKNWANLYSSGINNVIAQAMAKGQLVNDNSSVDMDIRLVHSVETTYGESGDSVIDLIRLTGQGDGSMDNIHALRAQYGADLVVLLAKVNDTGGVGWLLDTEEGLPSYAFSLVRVQQASWTYTMIHEMGHNMGAHHSKEQNFQPGPGLYSYSAGWRWTGSDDGEYCSIMTYEDGFYFDDGITHTRAPYWSNPNVSYQGVATGNAVDADNARTIRQIKNVIASYEEEVDAPGISIGAPSAAETNGNPVSYTVSYTDATNVTLSSSDISFQRTGTASATAAISGDGTATRTVTLSNFSGSGTLGISIAAGSAVNGVVPAPAAGPSATFSVTVYVNLSSSNFSNGWNMISFPDLSAGNTNVSLLPDTFKIRRYDASIPTYVKGEDGAFTLVPGQGYWIRADDANKVIGKRYVYNPAASVEVPIAPGWNLLGNPYQSNYALSAATVKLNNGTILPYEDAINQRLVLGYVWSWEASLGQYLFVAVNPARYATDASKQTFLNPYRGFWLYVRSGEVGSIVFNR